MPLLVRARLRIPTLLAATALGLVTACPEGEEDDSAADDGASGGELPDCMIAQQPACESAAGCFWSPQIDVCVIDCEPFETPMSCESAEFCEWTEDHCEHHAV